LFDKHSFFPAERWVGLGNYARIAGDAEFWDSLWKGVVYAGASTVLQLVLGLAAALVLHQAFLGRTAIRALVLFPYMIPTIVAVIVLRWLLNETYGVVDDVLVRLRLVREPVVWLGVDHMMTSLIAVSVWQFTPFVVVSVLARLQTIPLELGEAARVDGASAWARFRHITLPQLRGVLFVVVLLRSIWMFTKFDTVWLWGEGAGAGREIRTLPIYAYMRTFTYYQAGFGAALGLAAQAVLPLLWMLSTSLKPPREVFATPPTFVPASPTLESFARLVQETAFLTYFRNSVVVAGLTVVLTMAVGTLGAYSLTRFAFPGREAVAKLILCTYMFAPIMIVIPVYILARRLSIVDTHTALVLSYSSFCLPFSLWLLRAFFRSIPVELEEAARVDGAGRGRAVLYIVLPLALPGLIATSIFTFTLAWNDYVFTRILIASDELKTLPV